MRLKLKTLKFMYLLVLGELKMGLPEIGGEVSLNWGRGLLECGSP